MDSSQKLAKIIHDEQVEYYDFGLQIGKLLKSALSKKEKEKIVTEWFAEPETGPLINSVAILSDKINDLQVTNFYMPNKDT
mmetsp:Transcript_28801/g.27730  ORF Transcript_28801/g.27730 Transcript_28801/m.27730 type:complete len:81 (+) Transcript_28801:989-1231(+)